MGNAKKRRRARRLLKAHTKHGENRHVKSTAYDAKRARISSEMARSLGWKSTEASSHAHDASSLERPTG